MHRSSGVGNRGSRLTFKPTKLPRQHSVLVHHRSPAKRHLNGVSLAGCWWPALLLILSIGKISWWLKKLLLELLTWIPTDKITGSTHVFIVLTDTCCNIISWPCSIHRASGSRYSYILDKSRIAGKITFTEYFLGTGIVDDTIADTIHT